MKFGCSSFRFVPLLLPFLQSPADKKDRRSGRFCLLAGAEGIEPSSKVLETSVLPLNQAPRFAAIAII